MSAKTKSRQFPPTDHYQEVTNQILAAMEQKQLPWRKTWGEGGGHCSPRNAVTGKRYRGINIVLLAMAGLAGTGIDPRWCSYKQAASRGWQVRKGEHGSRIFFFKKIEIADRADPEHDSKHIPVIRASTVFHASQIDGIPAFEPLPVQSKLQKPEAVDIILTRSRIDLRAGGNRAFYHPELDYIQLPHLDQFESAEAWGATALHELLHAAGAKHRLNRDLTGRFGSSSYAMEELVAELGSCFVGSEMGLPIDIPNHASYLSGWAEVLRNDKRAIFKAASEAQRAAEYCLAFHPDYLTSEQADDDEGHDPTGSEAENAIAA
jgi:antirestriction protein ArdC